MPLTTMFKPAGANGFGPNSTAEQVTQDVDLTGKTYLLTGCNSGIGQETLRVLGLRGAHIIAAARTEEKARAALARTRTVGTPLACELSEPASVLDAVKTVKKLGKPLDGIICNAGIMALPRLEQRHGIEAQFFTNHIGHFILVSGLMDDLASQARVVVVASEAHRRAPRDGIQFDDLGMSKNYTPWSAYGHTKLANILFAKELARRFDGNGRTAVALHPGVIRTALVRHMNPLISPLMAVLSPIIFKSIAQGAATQCYLAAHPDAANVSGEYYSDCNPANPTRPARDPEMARRLWKKSEEIIAGLI